MTSLQILKLRLQLGATLPWRNIEQSPDGYNILSLGHSNLMRQTEEHMAFYGPVRFPPSSKDLGETVICKHLEASWRWHFMGHLCLKHFWSNLKIMAFIGPFCGDTLKQLEEGIWGAFCKAYYINFGETMESNFNQVWNKLKRTNKILAENLSFLNFPNSKEARELL